MRNWCIGSDLVEYISSSKEKINLPFSAKFSDPFTAANTYWSLRKAFVSGKKFEGIAGQAQRA